MKEEDWVKKNRILFLPQLRQRCLELRTAHFRYADLLGDLKLLNKVTSPAVKEMLLPTKEYITKEMASWANTIVWLRLECCDLGSTMLFTFITDEGEEEVKSMASLFDETKRTWRVHQLRRLAVRKSKSEQEFLAMNILKTEIEGLW